MFFRFLLSFICITHISGDTPVGWAWKSVMVDWYHHPANNESNQMLDSLQTYPDGRNPL